MHPARSPSPARRPRRVGLGPAGLAAAAAFSAAAGPALAQPLLYGEPRPQAEVAPPPNPADGPSVLSGVEVTAPKVVEKTRYGVVSSQIDMSVRVSYADLDMATADGAAELDRRVKSAATYVCGQLQKMYPVGTPEQFYCVKNAVGDAQPQVVQAKAPG